MNITNYRIYDLEESIVASGLPKMAEYDEHKFGMVVNDLKVDRLTGNIVDNPHFKRAVKLANAPVGSGHGNYLSGIVVSMNVTATNVWWMQLERYHFVQIVSSQSKMHRLQKMLQYDCFNGKTSFDTSMKFCNDVKNGAFGSEEEMIYSCPMGLELTARITTNYLQLKTIYNQRKNHKLTEWRQFCDWIKSLPYAKELITGEEN